MIRVGTTTLSEQDYDHRDYLATNVLKWLDTIVELKELMRGISETYNQWSLGSCTAMATTHGMKCQNEQEYKREIFLDWKDLWSKAGHSITKYDGGDSIERIVKLVLKQGIKGSVDGVEKLFSADARCYGKRDNWRKALHLTPLITAMKGDKNTWSEMTKWEVVTMVSNSALSHAVLIGWFDANYVYFYNSWGGKTVCTFKMTIANFEKGIACGMINWRWFGILDKDELNEFAKEKELSKQLIACAKKLYDIGDAETKAYFEKIWLSTYLQNKYKL